MARYFRENIYQHQNRVEGLCCSCHHTACTFLHLSACQAWKVPGQRTISSPQGCPVGAKYETDRLQQGYLSRLLTASTAVASNCLQEAALQNAIQSIEGPLALVTASLGGSLPISTATGPADSPNSPTASSSSQQMLSECSPASSSSFSAPQLDRNSGSISSRATKLAAAAYKGGAAMLQQITAREEKVQKVLQRLGCCDSTGYKQLYTTWLLQRAVSDPERVAEYVVHPRSQRLKFWSEVRP